MKIAEILFKIIQRLEKNNNADFESNGERRYLEDFFFKCPREVFVVDAGANVGEFTEMCLALAKTNKKKLNILTIEPQKEAFSELTAKFGDDSAVILEQSAVSNIEGTGTIFKDTDKSKHASLHMRESFEGIEVIKEEIKLRRLDNLLVENNCAKVDLLKLDVEGNEYKALLGSESFLKNGLVSSILIEYGGTYLSSNSSLKSIYDLLENLNYSLFKLFPNRHEKRSYSMYMENYQYANYVAVLNETENK